MTSIEVAVRVRPFNSREVKYGSQLIVAMQHPNCEIMQVKGGKVTSEQPKKYTFDHCFWTHDKEQVTPTMPFADQTHVYNALGKKILDNSLTGFNSCLFAYGQTGSGKTYSMMGIPSDPGIIPRLCRDLFHRAEAGKDTNTIVVECSYLEIYNELVRDLLNPANFDKPLRVRQHPKLGVYVENLTKLIVKHEDEIERLLEEGGKVRSVAATQMNATSSRSHAILTLYIKNRSKEGEVASQLHLVDLAGSERATSTGAEGDTLVEGANINKSLTTLGMCLSRLAEAGDGKKGHVPFRDSQLTWLLNDSLGGNSKTAMLANISPASINFEETLSTIRFAMTVKKIKNNAIVNEDPQQKLIRELREEIDEIRRKIREFEASGGGGGGVPRIAAATVPAAKSDEGERTTAAAHVDPNADGATSAATAIAGGGGEGGEGGVVLGEDNAEDSPNKQPSQQQEQEGQPSHEAERAAASAAPVEGETVPVDEDNEGDEGVESKKPQTREELMGLLLENTMLFQEIGQTDEERVAKDEATKANRARAMKALNESGVLVDPSMPRLVTLNENLHAFPTVALLYYLRPGENIIGSGDEDDAAPAAATTNESSQAVEGDQTDDATAQPASDDEEPKLPVSIKLPSISPTSAPGAAVSASSPKSPALAAAASTIIFPRHCSITVDSLRRSVHIRRLRSSTATKRKNRVDDDEDDESEDVDDDAPLVFVNGDALEDDKPVQLRHLDRIFIGTFAFRHSQPIVWYSQTNDDEFSRIAESTHHLECLERHERFELELEEEKAFIEFYAAPEASDLLSEDSRNWFTDQLQACLYHLGESETLMSSQFPLTQEALNKAAATKGDLGLDYDYAFAVAEKGRRKREEELARMREEKERTISELESTRRQQDAAIEELQNELARQTEAKQRAREQRDALEASLNATRGGGGSSSGGGGAAAASGAGGGASLGSTVSGESVVGLDTLRKSTAGGQAMLQLARDIDAFENECREAQLWKPGGPTKDSDRAEYDFSTSSTATLGKVLGMGEVLLEIVAKKYRVKKGMFSRSGFHPVKVVVRPRFLYYFDDKADSKSAPLGAVYLYGCAIQELKKNEMIDGRNDAIRLIPCVPRKPSKSAMSPTEENNVVLLMNTPDERQRVCELITQLATPVAPPNVAEYLQQEKLKGEAGEADED